MRALLSLDHALFGAEGNPFSDPGVLPTGPCLLEGRSVIDLVWDGPRLLLAGTLEGVDDYLRRTWGPVEVVVATLRAGALARAAGNPGPSQQTYELYHRIHQGISREMSLSEPGGVPQTAVHNPTQMLSEQAAWAGEPRVGDRIRG